LEIGELLDALETALEARGGGHPEVLVRDQAGNAWGVAGARFDDEYGCFVLDAADLGRRAQNTR
jgi:hypothetical protein